MNIVPCGFKSAIKPSNIFIAKDAPAFMVMMDTLGKMEHEVLGAHLVAASQDAGQWVGFVYLTQASIKTEFAKMFELGYLSETQVEGGWLVTLTQFAIELIYIRQTSRTIRCLEGEVQHARNAGFWAWCRRFFARRPTFA